jgi:2-polyprenyl-3-methyl-5-hydroxy-6-metoxy-1,4-benzoquinol methylase
MVGCNKRVLELGAAGGHVTRALVARHCRVTAIEYDADAAQDLKGIADDVVVADLNDPGTLARYTAEFDVVLAGDVLEHLLDPQAVLNRMARLIVPGGKIVLSVPNIAHADIKMSLLQGRFEYTPWGLLDRTHTRFFTLNSLRDLVRQAGLRIVVLERVRRPAFETEQRIDRQTVSTAILDEVMLDPESETYQFVVTAVPDDGDYAATLLAHKYEDLRLAHERTEIELTRQKLAFERQHQEHLARIQEIDDQRRTAEDGIARLQGTRLFRYTRALRHLYGSLRRGDR